MGYINFLLCLNVVQQILELLVDQCMVLVSLLCELCVDVDCQVEYVWCKCKGLMVVYWCVVVMYVWYIVYVFNVGVFGCVFCQKVL